MSTQPKPKRRRVTRTKRTGNDSLRSTLPGIALVVASVLPSALSPPTSGQPPTSERSRAAPTRPAAARPAALAFSPDCALPFDDIKTEGLAIDSICSENGNAGDDKSRLEADAKNNFCVDGDPAPVTYEDFKNLQAASDNVAGLKNALKISRDSLSGILKSAGGSQIGEGTLAQFVGFVLDARNSNVGKGKGELVNCNLPDKDENDIHIELALDPEEDPCNSVTAEMSPHFRPEAWDRLVDLTIKRPVRITGPLFFDGIHHQPCHDDKRPNPKRVSVWEIHPIYQFEVCKNKTLTACNVRDDSQWIPLDQWVSEEETEP